MRRTKNIVVKHCLMGQSSYHCAVPKMSLQQKAVSSISYDSLVMAGLADEGYTVKCFQPTAATRAVNSGLIQTSPDTLAGGAMQKSLRNIMSFVKCQLVTSIVFCRCNLTYINVNDSFVTFFRFIAPYDVSYYSCWYSDHCMSTVHCARRGLHKILSQPLRQNVLFSPHCH